MVQNDYLHELIASLTPIEVFDYYDGPRFYSCRDKLNQLFLVYWIDEDQMASCDHWLYLRISKERYSSLKNGYLSVEKILSDPEEETVFLVKNYGKKKFEVELISSSAIQTDWLPAADYYLNLPEKTLPEKVLSAVEVAKKSNREVFDLAFSKMVNSYEIGCGQLGKLLNSIEDTIYTLACDRNFSGGKIPNEVKLNNEILVTGVFASSFGVRLQSKPKDIDLFSNDDEATPVEFFANLISTLENPAEVFNTLYSFNISARAKFKHFLQVLSNSDISIKTDWGSPLGKTIKSNIPITKIRTALKLLEDKNETNKEVVKQPANLVGVDIESNFFALKIDNDIIINGKLSKSILNKQFDIPSRIIATFEKSCVIDPLTQKEKWTYVLMDFEKTAI